MPIAIFTHRATLQTSCKRQEALGTSENEPKTLSECQAFIASLLHSINPKDMILRQRDSLIATQSQAIVEVQDSLESLAEQVVPPKKIPRKKRNYQLPSHWPRVEVPYKEDDPTRSVCSEHGPRESIGFEIREKAVMIPAKFYVQVTKVPKLVCAGHPKCGVNQQPAPDGLVKGDKIDTSIGAQIVVQKYMYHVPVYRTEDIFASSGWTVARGTLLNIMCSMAYLFEGLYQHYRKQMVATGSMIATDDTIVELILPDYIPPPKPGDK